MSLPPLVVADDAARAANTALRKRCLASAERFAFSSACAPVLMLVLLCAEREPRDAAPPRLPPKGKPGVGPRCDDATDASVSFSSTLPSCGVLLHRVARNHTHQQQQRQQ
jgi:hypothetical protein